MYIMSGFFICLIGFLSAANPVHAELSLQQNRLTLHVQAVPLEEVLLNLSQEGAFRLTILDKPITDEVTVTEHFNSVPIEDGLSRLLAHWNYGLTKQSGSKKIQEVFLVSKRIKPEDLPTPKAGATPARSHSDTSETLVAFTEESSEQEYLEDHHPEGFEEEEFEGDQETFTEEMIPEDLPQEIRDAMSEDLARMNDH